VSVYLSVAPPDGFSKWGDAEWERWLKDHPWEAAERVCSRGDWTIFLYQLRLHAPRARQAIEPVLEALVNERPLTAQEADDLGHALALAREELSSKPASAMKTANNNFASVEDLDAMIAGARLRLDREPSMSDVWAEVFQQIDKVLENAHAQKRGIYFGNV
jgi:Ser/Thr protein kinase RdoA (MazF antagonist)